MLVVEAIRALLGLELAERLAVDIEILANRKRKELADTKELADLEQLEQQLIVLQQERDATQQQLEIEEQELTVVQQRQQEAFDKFVSEGGKIAGERKQLEEERDRKLADIETTRQGMGELAAGFYLWR